MLDIEKIRKDFPILHQTINGKQLIYLDNAATTQKPQIMIDELVHYYTKINANIHRGVHTLSMRATAAYDDTRDFVASLYGCASNQVIFTKSDTESLNLLAYTLGEKLLEADSNIVISESEHHSNIVPWQMMLNKKAGGYEYNQVKVRNEDALRYVRTNESGFIDIKDIQTKVDKNTKIFSFVWGSNFYGVINDAREIIKAVRLINPQTIIIIDAAQAVPHQKFNFQQLDADFITFSAHKLSGPTGVGILIGKEILLESIPPFLGGGDMIREVGGTCTTFADLPLKFEAGTPNIADVIAFKKSLEYLDIIGFDNILEHEKELAGYLLQKLNQLEFIEIYGPKTVIPDKIGIVSFNIKGVHPHDAGTMLDEEGIAVRTGHHCTQLIIKKLGISASIRASLYLYNTKEEVDTFVEVLKKIYSVYN